ncbi:hypothetical protein KIPB_015789, partial [Kipferlia bialata]|eukprot:g15789.t1
MNSASGWQAHYDPNSNEKNMHENFFFYNPATEETTWDEPEAYARARKEMAPQTFPAAPVAPPSSQMLSSTGFQGAMASH